MRLSLSISLLALIAVTGGCSWSSHSVKPIAYEQRLLVAVGDMQNQTGNEEYNNSMDGLTGSLLDALQETDCFRLIERQRLKSLLEEMKLGMTGLLDPNKTKEVGQLLGVDAILFVNLASVKYASNVDDAFIAKSEREKFEIIVDARLVAVTSGEILATVKIKSHYSKTIGTAFGFITSGQKADKKLVVQDSIEGSLQQMANELAWKISRRKKA